MEVADLRWRPLATGDLPLLATWLADAVVARWWAHDASPAGVERDFGPSVRGEEPGEDLLVLLGDRPVGLVQRSRLRDYPDDLAEFQALIDVPGDAVEVDYLLGPPDCRGQGLGPQVIAAVVAATWQDLPDVPACVVAVVAANRASWRACEKAGLRRVGEGPMAPDNPLDDPLHYVYRLDRP